MAYYGITAKVMVGEKEIGYISNWSIEETRDIIEITKLGNKGKEKFPTLYGWSGSADGTADFSSEKGQKDLRDAMIAGQEITVKFYLDAANYLIGKAYIESLSLDIAAEDKANISISLSGVGELTMEVVTP